MSLREKLNKNPAVAVGIAVVAIAVCGWFVWAHAFGSRGPAPLKAAFYTTDEGKTWFPDDVGKIAPFQKDGKEAVRIYLYRCGDGEPFVGYLQRYTAKGKEVTEKYNAEKVANPGKPPDSFGALAALGRGVTEVKRVGSDKWTSSGAPEALEIMRITCKDEQAVQAVSP